MTKEISYNMLKKEREKKMNKKIIIIISIIILVLILMLSFFFIFKMKKKNVTPKNNTYKVVLTIGGKKETKEVKDKDTLKLEKKEKEGYVFKGWKDKDGKIYTDEVKVNKDIELEAVFEKKEDSNTTKTPEEEKKPESTDDNKTAAKNYYCDKGYTLKGANCIKTEKINASSRLGCPTGFTEAVGKCTHVINAGPNCASLHPNGQWKLQGDGMCHHPVESPSEPNYEICPEGYELIQAPVRSKCKKTVDKVASYSCPAGYNLSGTSCFKTITIRAKVK